MAVSEVPGETGVSVSRGAANGRVSFDTSYPMGIGSRYLTGGKRRPRQYGRENNSGDGEGVRPKYPGNREVSGVLFEEFRRHNWRAPIPSAVTVTRRRTFEVPADSLFVEDSQNPQRMTLRDRRKARIEQ